MAVAACMDIGRVAETSPGQAMTSTEDRNVAEGAEAVVLWCAARVRSTLSKHAP